MDAAFRLIDSAFDILDTPGEQTFLGTGSGLHVHNTWHINRLDPAYDPNQCVWTATFVLLDATGLHTPSAPLVFYFTHVDVRPWTVPATGDFDGSGSADAGDLPALAECMSGADMRPAPNDPALTTCAVQCLNAFDFDDDHDLDLADVAGF